MLSDITSAVSARLEVARHALSLAPDDQADMELRNAREAMPGLRERAIATAREFANARGGEMEYVNLQDYYRAAKQVMDEANNALTEGATPFNIQQFGDMRDHTLENFEFRQEDLDIITADDDPLGLNLEERCLSFSLSGSTLSNVSFIPATTFNTMGIDNTGDITINNAIFHGMESDQVLHLAAGEYTGLSIVHVAEPSDTHGRINTSGAIIQLESGAHVKDLNVSGQTIGFVLAPRSALVDLNTEGATILRFDAQSAMVQNAHLAGNTIAMNSNMTDMQWTATTFENVNLQGHDFSGNRFNNCELIFTDPNVERPLNGVNFSGARMNTVTLNGEPVTFDMLADLGVALNAMPSINGQTYEQSLQVTPQQEAMAAARNLAMVLGGGQAQDASTSDIVLAYAPITPEAQAARDADNAQWLADASALRLGVDA